jgi:hypothetical protein
MTPGNEDEISQAEKARIIRERANVFINHTTGEIEIPGRFGAINRAEIVGQKSQDPWPTMPEGNPWCGPDPCGQERSFGVQLTEFGQSQTVVPEKKK